MSVRGGQGPRDPVASPTPTRRANPYQRTGRYGRGPGDQRRYERYGDQRSGLGGIVRFLLFLFVLAAVVLVVMGTVARPLVRAVVVPWAWDNPAALQISLISDLVREDLGSALTAPASADDSTVEFVVEPGDTPTTLAPKLEEAGIIDSQRAFLFEARADNLLSKLNAGRYSLALNLTPAGVVDGLVNNLIKNETIPVTFREGLRLEQMTAKLETITAAPRSIRRRSTTSSRTRPTSCSVTIRGCSTRTSARRARRSRASSTRPRTPSGWATRSRPRPRISSGRCSTRSTTGWDPSDWPFPRSVACPSTRS